MEPADSAALGGEPANAAQGSEPANAAPGGEPANATEPPPGRQQHYVAKHRRPQEPGPAGHPGSRRAEALQALRLAVPVGMAYVPLGLAFGVLMVTSGLRWFWAPLSALVIFAGSIEFLAISLILSGVAVPQVALTTLAVNFRHIFYGLSFPLARLRSRPQKAYGIFALTDETYGITSTGAGSRLDGFGITVLQVISHCWWVGGAALGALIGQVVPSGITGFEFALTAMFVTLAVDAVRASRDFGLVAAALVAAALAYLVDHFVLDESFLFVGLLLYLGWVTLGYLRGQAHHDG